VAGHPAQGDANQTPVLSARQLGLAARVVLATIVGVLALAGDTLAAETAPAAKCCYRVDTLVQAELDTIFNSTQVGGMVGHQEALVTYRSVELLTLSTDGTLRRANGGSGVAFGKALVKNEIGAVLPDQTYKYIAKCNKGQTTKTYRADSRALVRFADGDSARLVIQAGRTARAAAAAADKGCDRTRHGIAANNLDGLSPGGAASVLVTAPTPATFLGAKLFRAALRISFDDDNPHNPGTRPHDQVGGMTVDLCFRYVSPGRLKGEAAKIRALAGKKPSESRTLPCR
jgi:hypothetical protein